MDDKDRDIWELKRANRNLVDENVALKEELAVLKRDTRVKDMDFLYFKKVTEMESLIKEIFLNAEYITRRVPIGIEPSAVIRVPAYFKGRLATVIIWNNDLEVGWNENNICGTQEKDNKFYERTQRKADKAEQTQNVHN